ncbi:MAG: acyl-ACP--UDP-N-acetylglucosamine O-acyltransferase [Arhodomonas sp.]|nr:acyl-ACP--UDP-N-acetylglucosamine O-acyltransferase [Arhodomonas sp.]
MDTSIHATATVDAHAELEPDVVVGAGAVIGEDVRIGTGTRVGPLAVILGPTRIGRDNTIHAHACLGDAPQDLAYRGEPTRLEIGDGNHFREFVTVHRGSTKDEGVTRIGDDNLLMAYSHVGHDCRVGSGITMANCATLAGHVSVGDHANIAGLSAIHQFARVGCHAMLGGGTIAVMDIPPYTMASGNHARLYGLNRRGLRRAGMAEAVITALRRAYRLLFRSGLGRAEAIAEVRRQGWDRTPEVAHLLGFLESSRRGVTR